MLQFVFLLLSRIPSILCYLVIFNRHILLAELKDGLPCSHIQRVSFLAQQQRGVVEDPRLRKLHQI